MNTNVETVLLAHYLSLYMHTITTHTHTHTHRTGNTINQVKIQKKIARKNQKGNKKTFSANLNDLRREKI